MQGPSGTALSTSTVVLAAALTHQSVRRRRGTTNAGLGAAGLGMQAIGTEIMPSKSSTVACTENNEAMLGGFIPPDDVRNRIKLTRGWLGKDILAFIGDTVWEFMVLRHQYTQGVRSALTESQHDRATKQGRAAVMLYRKRCCLSRYERNVMKEGMSGTWKAKIATNPDIIKEIGIEMYSAALGLRTLLGYLYMDADSSDRRLEHVANQLGLLGEEGMEDQLLSQVTQGVYNPAIRQSGTYFLALAPLGHACLRLYIIRYLGERPTRSDEFIYRVKLALRQEELDVASLGFLKDDATAEEARLVKSARDAGDSYAFAFECLLGHLALTAPYRLHQIIAGFGFAKPLPGT